jgi:hypothetical protein
MPKEVYLYDGHYGHLAADPQVAVRRQTYDEDLGQATTRSTTFPDDSRSCVTGIACFARTASSSLLTRSV